MVIRFIAIIRTAAITVAAFLGVFALSAGMVMAIGVGLAVFGVAGVIFRLALGGAPLGIKALLNEFTSRLIFARGVVIGWLAVIALVLVPKERRRVS
jgi:hypothetical protein